MNTLSVTKIISIITFIIIIIIIIIIQLKFSYIMLPRTSVCVKSYDRETKWMNFLIKYDKLVN